MRILVLSDIHGNYDALKAVLEKEEFDEAIVLGDLVDYGPEPEKVVDSIKSLTINVVRGNHDHAVAYNTDCRCSPALHELSVYTRFNVSLKKLSKEDISYLRSLPVKKELSINDINVLLVHATESNPLYGYLYPWNGLPEIREAFKNSIKDKRHDIILVGHTHYQFSLNMPNGVKIVNPGSVGQPRDGDWRASYAVLVSDGGEITVSLHRVKYPIESVINKIENQGLKEKYVEILKRILLNGKI